MPLSQGNETKIDIVFDQETYKHHIQSINNSLLDVCDIENASGAFMKILEIYSTHSKSKLYSDMDYEEFIQFNVDSNLMVRLEVLSNDTMISEKAKGLLRDEFKVMFLDGQFLDYLGTIELDYINNYPEEEWDKYIAPSAPDRSYYKLLKEFNLNAPKYAYTSCYSTLFQILLTNDTLNIQAINDTPIDEWLKKTKVSLSDLVGFNEGMFYDVLIGNAYNLSSINKTVSFACHSLF